MRLKWSKESRFFAGQMVVENWFSAQYAPAREEHPFFIISYNRKKQNERQKSDRYARVVIAIKSSFLCD